MMINIQLYCDVYSFIKTFKLIISPVRIECVEIRRFYFNGIYHMIHEFRGSVYYGEFGLENIPLSKNIEVNFLIVVGDGLDVHLREFKYKIIILLIV